jgi:hypothetical protein
LRKVEGNAIANRLRKGIVLRVTENLFICERGVALYSVHATVLIRTLHKPATPLNESYK